MIIVLLVIGYLCGSIPFGYLVGKLRKIDLQKEGFKKIGASNAYKTMGLLPALLVFFADFTKGIIPLLIGKWLGIPDNIAVFSGLTAIIGHNWPVWLKFKGEGRGVATSTGLVFYLLPREFTLIFFVLMLLVAIMKNTGLASFICFLLVPVLGWLFKEPVWLINFSALIFVAFAIRRLLGLTKVPRGKRKANILSSLFLDRQKESA